jgi:hypothetical protein
MYSESYAASSPSDEGLTRRRSLHDQSQNSLSPPEQSGGSLEPNSELPLFDIEKDGDPRIEWWLYYDFFVTKSEAYFQLHPGYLVTEKYPFRIKSEKVIV